MKVVGDSDAKPITGGAQRRGDGDNPANSLGQI